MESQNGTFCRTAIRGRRPFRFAQDNARSSYGKAIAVNQSDNGYTELHT